MKNKIIIFLKNNISALIIVILLFLIYLKLCHIVSIIDSDIDGIYSLLDDIKSSVSDFYSDWFRNL